MKKTILWVIGLPVLLAVTAIAAFKLSPWPGALMIRWAFEKDAARTSVALEGHVPTGVHSITNLRYDESDDDALLDIHYPASAKNATSLLPTLVWIHGGGWVSGSKEEIANYARIIAGHGYAVVGVDYSLAPRRIYPTPVRQVNASLSYLAANASRLRIDSDRLLLAGDSAGAHIAAQLANAIASPGYARTLDIAPAITRRQLVGVILYCGPYDTRNIEFEGEFAGFLTTVLWSYSGGRDFMNDPAFASASVIDHVSADFPPTFISVGNGDPLAAQSHALADKLTGSGIEVDTLFFAKDDARSLPHEYQFNLDTQAGQIALSRSLAFLAMQTSEKRPAIIE